MGLIPEIFLWLSLTTFYLSFCSLLTLTGCSFATVFSFLRICCFSSNVLNSCRRTVAAGSWASLEGKSAVLVCIGGESKIKMSSLRLVYGKKRVPLPDGTVFSL